MSSTERDWDAFTIPKPGGQCQMDLAVEGITCAACMSEIETTLTRLPGVSQARVNLTSRRLAVGWESSRTDARAVVTALEALGYKAHPFDPAHAASVEEGEARFLMRCLAVAGFAAMNVMLFSVSIWAGNVTDITQETRDLFHWLSALIALPAAAYAGRPFFTSAWRALRNLRTNMDVPISIGIIITLALSVFQTLRSEHHAYFDSAVMLLFFLLLGRFLDHNMRRRTRSVAENLAALRGETAARIGPDGTVKDVPLSKIDPGDRVLVRPGERISVDGIVERGTSDIDQSLVTGETATVAVTLSDRVYAGTMNVTGTLTVRVTAATEDTLLSEVNRLLEAAAQAKSKYMRLADRVARHYAPVVHTAALLTFLAWTFAVGLGWQDSLVIAVSVLIITCPCALALAIPTVQVVTSGVLFRRGLLIHSGDAIERLATVDTVVFDKTGTLTLPRPDWVGMEAIDAGVRARAASLAATSRHPLGMALARLSGDTGQRLDATEYVGEGVETIVDGEVRRLGSPAFCGVSAREVERVLGQFPGASLVAYREGDAAPVIFPFSQVLRPDAVAVIAALKARGLAIEILSGDRPGPVEMAAKALGIETWRSDLKPADKIARLEALKAQGRKVMMVGDGLNDAPALAAAHVSLSPVSAVHISQAAADAVFLGERLAPVVDVFDVARRARRAMIENLWISIVYNIIAVPVAMLGFITPLIAALAMSGSSLIVTLNALKLRTMRVGLGEAMLIGETDAGNRPHHHPGRPDRAFDPVQRPQGAAPKTEGSRR
jgi:P-type Cu2+ transporter